MTNEHSIAFKYAKALFLAAEEEGVLEEVGDDSARILTVLRETPELDAFLRNSAASEKETAKALMLLFHDSVGELSRRFLALLSKNRRISLLEITLKRFEKFRDDALNILRVRLEYAGTLTEESRRVIVDFLRSKIADGGEVVIEEVFRPGLIGGVRLIVGGRLYDNSVKTSLKSLSERLLSADVSRVSPSK
jgi:F-type H+-transporting ATPase subunit delta